jgi:bifunctional enzyme CysN/CysC
VRDPASSADQRSGVQQTSGLLRFMTCGSVDDGKSTLIGRLLYESESLPDDQVAALRADSARIGTQGKGLDYALLVDGLIAEREQAITIDVAYRFFSTARRKFIVADAPGHEQYTRNMATAASTAELAVVLLDASKGDELLTQTRRHSYIATLLGVRRLVLAVNKMDLVNYDRSRFQLLAGKYRTFARTLGVTDVECIPVSALHGDNVVVKSTEMPWYGGPALLAYLENIETDTAPREKPFRMPVQWVNRPNADFRGFCGTIASGTLALGDTIKILPSGNEARASRIIAGDQDVTSAGSGQAVTLVLDREIEAGRGTLFCDSEKPAEVADQFAVHLLWMSAEAMIPGRLYLLKAGANTTSASITSLKYQLNVNTLEHLAARTLELNEIAVCNISLDRPIPFAAYAECRALGSFILIDRVSNETVGMGVVDFALHRAGNIQWQPLAVGRDARALQKRQRSCVLWFTGLSGSGKSTIANALEARLFQRGLHTYVLDGDNIRHGLNRDLGFTEADRVENIRRVAEVASLMADAGLVVLVSFISPFRSERAMARGLMRPDEFVEIFVDAPLPVCEARDPKGLYRKARRGEISNFTGLDSPYEPPQNPELRLDTSGLTVEQTVVQLMDYLERDGKLKSPG